MPMPRHLARRYGREVVGRSADLPGWLKVAFRVPNALYDKGFGRLLGPRFLRLTHTGRRTGAPHHVVLEVVGYDRRSGEAVVISGFGESADWLRNLEAGGPAAVDFGRGPRAAAHRRLGLDEAEAVYAAYERRNVLLAPGVRWTLTALLGWRYDGSPAARRRMLEEMPMVALRPRAAQSSGPPAT